jgi:hypothetical protein
LETLNHIIVRQSKLVSHGRHDPALKSVVNDALKFQNS